MAFSSARSVLSRIPRLASINHPCPVQGLSTSTVFNAKQIVEREENDVTVIQAEFVDSPHTGNVIASAEPGCPLCRLRIHNVSHDDVLILSQFMHKDGSILPRSVTGLCPRQHAKISRALYRAQRIGLIKSEENAPKERWQELNNYFGNTKTKTDFGKPKIDIREFLKRPKSNLFWKDNKKP